MNSSSEEFFKKLLDTFKIEAEEHLQSISNCVLDLEATMDSVRSDEIIELALREAHSLKGASRAVNLFDIANICQSLEDVFSMIRKNEIKLTPNLFDLVHRTVDLMSDIIVNQNSDITPEIEEQVDGIIAELEEVKKTVPLNQPKKIEEVESLKLSPRPAVKSGTPVKTASKPGTVRVTVSKLDTLLLQVEEMLTAKLTSLQHAEDLKNLRQTVFYWRKEWDKIERDFKHDHQKKVGQSNKIFTEISDWNNAFFRDIDLRLSELNKIAEQDNRALSGMVDNLLDDMKQVLMLPFSYLLDMFPKTVRDLAKSLGKTVHLEVIGDSIEVDRRLLDELKDPLIHILRNCVDHGIETPEARKLKNKKPQGNIVISISQKSSSKVEVTIADDGAGIDVDDVVNNAVKLGIITLADLEDISFNEKLNLIFFSGISTSSVITDVSGRGLGLAIVKEKVENLEGTLSVDTRHGSGTTFTLVLPLTFATFKGILVKCAGQIFVIPKNSIEKVVRVNKDNIKTVKNKETISINDQVIAYSKLKDVLGLSGYEQGSDGKVKIVIIKSSNVLFAFEVDEVLGEQEILVKSLGKQLLRIKNIAGATVLGDGKVAPILNSADLVKRGISVSGGRAKQEEKFVEETAGEKSILVVEDSITSRTLLKNILQAAGYSVKTAVDGMDALTQLRIEQFDLMISDVEMPRLNGFDLTGKVRADSKFSDMPIILVTSLGTREDKERGIEAGANAYIVKSNFDQSNLLEAVGRLI